MAHEIDYDKYAPAGPRTRSKKVFEKTDDDTAKAVFNARAGIRAEIEPLIAPYRASPDEPPFSTPELIVLALAWKKNHKASKRWIFSWILRHFRFYNRKAITRYINTIEADCNSDGEISEEEDFGDYDDVVPGFRSAFNLYDIPLSTGDPLLDSPATEEDEVYTVTRQGARCFLRGVLENPRKGPFRFLDLPVELRINIYEMVFALPKIWIGRVTGVSSCGEYGLVLSQREHDPDSMSEVPEGWVCTKPVSKLLALLSVNKQIHQEAMPYFYRVNSFHFSSMEKLSLFAQSLAATRLHHLGELIVTYNAFPVSHAPQINAALGLLAAAKAPNRLHLVCEERRWFDLVKYDGKQAKQVPKYAEAHQLPGLRALCRVLQHVGKLDVDGDCPRIEAYLRSEMAKLKALPEPVAAPTKRARKAKEKPKSEELVQVSDDEAEKPKKKRAKKAKAKES